MFQFYCGKSLLNYPLNMILLLRVSSTFHAISFSLSHPKIASFLFVCWVHFFSQTPEIIIRSFLPLNSYCVFCSFFFCFFLSFCLVRIKLLDERARSTFKNITTSFDPTHYPLVEFILISLFQMFQRLMFSGNN